MTKRHSPLLFPQGFFHRKETYRERCFSKDEYCCEHIPLLFRLYGKPPHRNLTRVLVAMRERLVKGSAF